MEGPSRKCENSTKRSCECMDGVASKRNPLLESSGHNEVEALSRCQGLASQNLNRTWK